MTDQIHLRDAEISDAPALARISVSGWQQAYAGLLPRSYLEALDVDARTRGWVQLLGSGTAQAIVAELSGVVAGFISFGPSRDADADTSATAEVYAVYVDPDRWRHGIGRVLLDAAVARSMPVTACTLWVLAGNIDAQGFYRSQGFEPDGATKTEDRNGVLLHEVRYRRALTGL